MAVNLVLFKRTEIINLGKVTSYDCSSISGYQGFTVDNFIVELIGAPSVLSSNSYQANMQSAASGFTVSKSYNATTGVLTITNVSQTVYMKNGRYNECSITQNMNYRVLLVT